VVGKLSTGLLDGVKVRHIHLCQVADNTVTVIYVMAGDVQ